MLKLNASFSKKIPAEQEYSSQSYHCSIEVEIPDGTGQDQLRRQIHDTFQMVRATVEDELRNAPVSTPQPQPETTGPNPGFQRASNKQLKYLLDLAQKQGKDPRAMNAVVQQRYSIPTVYELSRKQASALIDDLNGNRRAA